MIVIVRASASIPIDLRVVGDRLAATDGAGLMRVIAGEDDDPVLDALIAPKCHPVFNHPAISSQITLNL